MNIRQRMLGMLAMSAFAMSAGSAVPYTGSIKQKPAKTELTPKQLKARKRAKHNRKCNKH